MDVTVISVCYNSTSVVRDMLNSLPEDTPVILIDNASDDLVQLLDIAKKYSTRVIRNDENLGFGAACNQGAQLANTKYILFLNPDTTLGSEALNVLCEAAANYSEYSAFSPLITDNNGKPTIRRRSILIDRCKWLDKKFPITDFDVPVLSGAAIFVSRTAFEEAGGFDPAIFMYHEDDDLSLQLRKKVGPLKLIRGAIVGHNAGHSTERSPKIARLKAYQMGRSRVYALTKHQRPFPRTSSLLMATIQLFSPAVFFSKRKRAKQFALFSGVVSAFFDGGKTTPSTNGGKIG